LLYDVSNACLGLLNGVLQAANMIELGQVRAALVLGTESSRPLVETTIEALNRDESVTRSSIKSAVASLTIGSASAAVLLTDRESSRTGNRLQAAAARANTDFHQLCQGSRDEAIGSGMRPLMETDSEQLLREGVATGVETFRDFLATANWDAGSIGRTFCHQVGVAHRKLMLESLGLAPERDFVTYPWLGNTGSVALPVTMALGLQGGHVRSGDRVALLGIGSGINCVMLAVQWQQTLVGSRGPCPEWALAPVGQWPGYRTGRSTISSSFSGS